MGVDLMLSPIIDLGCGLCPGVFLFVVEPVLGTRLHSRFLQSNNRLVGSFTGQKWIAAEAFPVPTT